MVRKQLSIAAAIALVSVVHAHAGGNPIPAEYCQKFHEQGATRTTVTIQIDGQTCTMKTPPKQLCSLPVIQPTAADPAARGLSPQQYFCYKVKCPKNNGSTTLTDQFGTHNGTTKSPNTACFFAFGGIG